MTATGQRVRRPWLVAGIVSLAAALGACGALDGGGAACPNPAPEGEPRASGRVPDPSPGCGDERAAQAMRSRAAGRRRSRPDRPGAGP